MPRRRTQANLAVAPPLSVRVGEPRGPDRWSRLWFANCGHVRLALPSLSLEHKPAWMTPPRSRSRSGIRHFFGSLQVGWVAADVAPIFAKISIACDHRSGSPYNHPSREILLPLRARGSCPDHGRPGLGRDHNEPRDPRRRSHGPQACRLESYRSRACGCRTGAECRGRASILQP